MKRQLKRERGDQIFFSLFLRSVYEKLEDFLPILSDDDDQKRRRGR